MTQTSAPEKDAVALVGEYALHLLDVAGRLVFEERLAGDPALQILLREWEEGLVSLATEIRPVTPPARLKAFIEAKLFEQPDARNYRAIIADKCPSGVFLRGF